MECVDLHFSPKTSRPEPAGTAPAISLEKRGVSSHFQQSLGALNLVSLKETVISKLLSANARDLAEPLIDCHTRYSVAVCCGCSRVRRFANRCEVHYCPCCQPRLSRERQEGIEWWTKLIRQPKHVILTCRNRPTLTTEWIRDFKEAFTKLRRSKFAAGWRGGMYSIEITNESAGWHLHLHALIDADYIDAGELAVRWGKLVGQDFAIVCVRDARDRDYLREVCKYTVKGTSLAAWEPQLLVEYIRAMQGIRSFGVFGSLFKRRAEWSEFQDTLNSAKPACDCGCTHTRIMTDQEYEWFQLTHDPPEIPVPAIIPQTELVFP